VAAVVAGLVWVSKRRARMPLPAEAATWPPLPADGPAVGVAAVAEDLAAAVEEPDVEVALAPDPVGSETGTEAPWVLPKDGACPEGYPVKAKVASGIYHVPGGLSYARTTPDRCYASAADAEVDGFRPAKR
jgi:hypothetical protein